MKLTPASSARLTSAVAPCCSTVPMLRQKPAPPWNVIVPRQISETNWPVRPSGRYFIDRILFCGIVAAQARPGARTAGRRFDHEKLGRARRRRKAQTVYQARESEGHATRGRLRRLLDR